MTMFGLAGDPGDGENPGCCAGVRCMRGAAGGGVGRWWERARMERSEALGVLAKAQRHRVQQPRHPIPVAWQLDCQA